MQTIPPKNTWKWVFKDERCGYKLSNLQIKSNFMMPPLQLHFIIRVQRRLSVFRMKNVAIQTLICISRVCFFIVFVCVTATTSLWCISIILQRPPWPSFILASPDCSLLNFSTQCIMWRKVCVTIIIFIYLIYLECFCIICVASLIKVTETLTWPIAYLNKTIRVKIQEC